MASAIRGTLCRHSISTADGGTHTALYHQFATIALARHPFSRISFFAFSSLSAASLANKKLLLFIARSAHSVHSIGTFAGAYSVYSAALAASVAWPSNGLEKRWLERCRSRKLPNLDSLRQTCLLSTRRFCVRRLQCGDQRSEERSVERSAKRSSAIGRACVPRSPASRPQRLAYSIDRKQLRITTWNYYQNLVSSGSSRTPSVWQVLLSLSSLSLY